MLFEEKGFRFGEFFLNPDEQILKRNGIEVQLTPKAIEVLTELVRHPGHVVSKSQLMESVWANSMVEEANLPFTVGLVRKALGDDVKKPRFIETLSKKGYRFIEPVVRTGASDNQTFTRVNDDVRAADLSELLALHPRSNRRYLFVGALTFIGLTLAVVFWGIASKMWPRPVGRIALQQVTTNGQAELLSASPSGKFLAYVRDMGDYQTLWLHDVATNSETMLSPQGARDTITAVTFAPDEEHIFYVSSSRLVRMPVLGGKPELILDDVIGKTNVAISPDGKYAAFLRPSADRDGGTDLMSANLEDRSENILATSQDPRQFYSRVAWSPDGKSIACAKWGAAGEGLAIVILDADSGAEMQRFKMVEVVSDLAWKYDGSAVLTAACHSQICRVLQYDLSGRDVATVTNDLINYTGLSMASIGRQFFAIRQDSGANLWVLRVGDDRPAKQITNGFNRFDGISALAWVAGDRLVFNSQPRETGETDSVKVDGSEQDQIANTFADGISPDGRYIVLRPGHEEIPVIRIYDTTTGKTEPITTGNLDVQHAVSPDGRWTAFTRWTDGRGIWKVSMSGGDAVRLTTDAEMAEWPAISPDGKFVAFYSPRVNSAGGSTVDIAYVSSDGGGDIKRFVVDAQLLENGKTAPQWSADGKSIYFVRLRDGASNIWKQPIDGSEPMQITHLKTGRIYNFAFSPDESQIALSYGPFSRDIVQIDYRSGD